MQFTFTESEVENNNKWSQEDDQRLEQAFKLYGPQWQKIQEFIKGKTKSECVQRWSQMKSGKKTPWTKEEDELLKELVMKYGENWNEIASIMKTRTGNQIRNRYINQIIAPPPRPWTQEEDEQLLNYYSEYGSKWTQIAKLMKDRSEIQVKNRFYTKHQKELANQKPSLKLQVQDQEMEKQEEIEVKTFKTETPCKQETDQIEPEIQKKVDTKQQQILDMEHNFAYYCPRNLLTMIEKLFDPSPNEPKKFCWVPIPVLRLNKNFKVPEQSTNTKLENISDNLKQEDK